MTTIEIIVSPEGNTRLETKGFTGEQCRQASRFLEEALGQPTSETLTAEFHEAQQRHSNHIDQEQ